MSEAHVDFDSLSTAEKILHVQDLWDRIASGPQGDGPELTDVQRADLDRRVKAHQADPDSGASWEEVRDRIRSRS